MGFQEDCSIHRKIIAMAFQKGRQACRTLFEVNHARGCNINRNELLKIKPVQLDSPSLDILGIEIPVPASSLNVCLSEETI